MKTAKITSILVFLVSAVLFGYCILVRNAGMDKNGPEIQMDTPEIQVSIEAGEEELLQGVTAVDKKDGDVTSSLVVESISNFIEKGRRKVSLVAFDSDHNITRATREIVYTDYTSPQFSFSGPMRFSTTDDGPMEMITATDCLDGDLTNKVHITYGEGTNYYTPGTYQITISVSNSAGDVTKLPVSVEIYDEQNDAKAPKLDLSEYLVNLPVGSGWNPWDYLSEVDVNGEHFVKGEDGYLHGAYDTEAVMGPEQVYIENPVDPGTPGVYEVVYSVSDSEGVSGSIRLVVSVIG